MTWLLKDYATTYFNDLVNSINNDIIDSLL